MTYMPPLDMALARVDETLPSLPGWCTVAKGRRICQLVVETRPAVVVELGVYGGRSLVALAFGCAQNKYGHVDGFDPYARSAALEGVHDRAVSGWWATVDYESVLRQAGAALTSNKLDAYAEIHRMRSQDAVPRFAVQSIDILHQDSNHSSEVSTAEVVAWAPLVRPGGYWIFDDTNWPSTARAQALLIAAGYGLMEDHACWRIYNKRE
jgi:cephalosporin hydroxylase